MLLMIFLTLTQKWSKRRQARPDSSWLGATSSPEPEVVILSSELCPSTDSLPGAYQVQEEESQESHSPDRGSSMGYASGGSSPEQAYEGQNPNYKEKPQEYLKMHIKTPLTQPPARHPVISHHMSQSKAASSL